MKQNAVTITDKPLPKISRRRHTEAMDVLANLIMLSEKARREGEGVYGEEWYRQTMMRGYRLIGGGDT